MSPQKKKKNQQKTHRFLAKSLHRELWLRRGLWVVLEIHRSSGAQQAAPEEQEQWNPSIFREDTTGYLRIFLPDDMRGCSLLPCSIQRPPDCTHLVFKDDFDEYQQQLCEEDHQKDPEELKRERKGLALLRARLCRLSVVNHNKGDLETESCFETLRNQIISLRALQGAANLFQRSQS